MNGFYSKPREAIASLFPGPARHITYEHAIHAYQAYQVHPTYHPCLVKSFISSFICHPFTNEFPHLAQALTVKITTLAGHPFTSEFSHFEKAHIIKTSFDE